MRMAGESGAVMCSAVQCSAAAQCSTVQSSLEKEQRRRTGKRRTRTGDKEGDRDRINTGPRRLENQARGERGRSKQEDGRTTRTWHK